MMRYSEISRDLSSDSLRYVDLSKQQCREETPSSDISKCSGSILRRTPPSSYVQHHHHHHHQQQQQQKLNNENDYSNFAADKRNSTNLRSIKVSSANAIASYIQQHQQQRKDSTKSTKSCQLDMEQQQQQHQHQHQHHQHQHQQLQQNNIKPQAPLSSLVNGSKALNMKCTRRKNSIGCLNTFSSSPDSPGCYYTIGSTVPPPGKSQSLPAHSSIKHIDSVIMSALRLAPDELANQITLLDYPIFAAIQPEELTSCAWTKKDKHIVTPNIVAFTKRFNHTSFWTVQEILSGEQAKQRAEILSHFIKVAKKLHELNNLHSLFAIVSAMQSASIYRLKKTWACLTKKERQTFERLSDIFSDQNNWENLRAYYKNLRLPCIPYLGLFLTDLIYIDLAHPHKGGLESEPRRDKMNNILRVISNYQQSNYTQIPPIESTQKYLTSIRYIEELQNIFEEDQYKRSLRLEPVSASGPSSSSCSSKESFNVESVTPALACLNLSPAKTIGSMRMASGTKFVPGHRKCRSLGTKFRSTSLPRNFVQRCQCSILMIAPGIGTISNKRCRCRRIFGKIVHTANNHSSQNDATINFHHQLTEIDQSVLLSQQQQQQSRHPLDDSVLEQHSHALNAADLTSLESADGILCDFSGSDMDLMSPDAAAVMQGCVRRKTVQKEGRKPAVASWQRYWVQIWANSLVYFPPKSFKGCERSDFKREQCKVCPLEGWYAQISDNTKHKNTFELYHRTIGTIYKFRTDSPQATRLWTNAICKMAASRVPKPLPANLMSFE